MPNFIKSFWCILRNWSNFERQCGVKILENLESNWFLYESDRRKPDWFGLKSCLFRRKVHISLNIIFSNTLPTEKMEQWNGAIIFEILLVILMEVSSWSCALFTLSDLIIFNISAKLKSIECSPNCVRTLCYPT